MTSSSWWGLLHGWAQPWEGFCVPWSLLGTRCHRGISSSNSAELNCYLPFISIFPSL